MHIDPKIGVTARSSRCVNIEVNEQATSAEHWIGAFVRAEAAYRLRSVGGPMHDNRRIVKRRAAEIRFALLQCDARDDAICISAPASIVTVDCVRGDVVVGLPRISLIVIVDRPSKIAWLKRRASGRRRWQWGRRWGWR